MAHKFTQAMILSQRNCKAKVLKILFFPKFGGNHLRAQID